MEDYPMPQFNRRGRLECPAAIRSVTLSVPQLVDVAAFFEAGIGLKASTVAVHAPEHEALWGLAGATTESRVFDGGEVLIEAVQYLDPAGRPNSTRCIDVPKRLAPSRIADQFICPGQAR
jgi:hypothetical protein